MATFKYLIVGLVAGLVSNQSFGADLKLDGLQGWFCGDSRGYLRDYLATSALPVIGFSVEVDPVMVARNLVVQLSEENPNLEGLNQTFIEVVTKLNATPVVRQGCGCVQVAKMVDGIPYIDGGYYYSARLNTIQKAQLLTDFTLLIHQAKNGLITDSQINEIANQQCNALKRKHESAEAAAPTTGLNGTSSTKRN